MSSYNRVILMGNLTRDPEVRYANNGTAICRIGLAVNRRFKDSQTGDWREEATFIDVTMFGKRGEAFAKYHTKGRTAFIEGSLRLDTWDDKQSGQKRSKLYVVGDEWQFVGGREGGEPAHSRSSGGGFEGRGDSGGSDSGSGSDSASGGGSGGGGGEPDFLDEDAPF